MRLQCGFWLLWWIVVVATTIHHNNHNPHVVDVGPSTCVQSIMKLACTGDTAPIVM